MSRRSSIDLQITRPLNLTRSTIDVRRPCLARRLSVRRPSASYDNWLHTLDCAETVETLRNNHVNPIFTLRALCRLIELSGGDINNGNSSDPDRAWIASCGGCEVLIEILKRYTSYPEIIQRACTVLRNLTRNDEINSNFGILGGCELVVESFSSNISNAGVAEQVCSLIRNLSRNIENKSIFMSLDTIKLIIQAIKLHMSFPGLAEQGCISIYQICGFNKEGLNSEDSIKNLNTRNALKNIGGYEIIQEAVKKHSIYRNVVYYGNIIIKEWLDLKFKQNIESLKQSECLAIFEHNSSSNSNKLKKITLRASIMELSPSKKKSFQSLLSGNLPLINEKKRVPPIKMQPDTMIDGADYGNKPVIVPNDTARKKEFELARRRSYYNKLSLKSNGTKECSRDILNSNIYINNLKKVKSQF